MKGDPEEASKQAVMAKSIRSKVKKRNRTEMRKNVGDPHQRKLQARCTAKIQKAVAFSAGVCVCVCVCDHVHALYYLGKAHRCVFGKMCASKARP